MALSGPLGGLAPLVDGSEAHDDVGVGPLRADELGGLGLSFLELLSDLLLGVAPLLGVAAQLPGDADVLRRVEVHGDVEATPGPLGVQREQPLDDHELTRLDILRATERDYQLAVSTGAQRASQAVACMLAGLGQPGLRSDAEDRWRAIKGEASGSGVAAFRVFDSLDDGGRALVVGHSPTNEAAVLGLTGEVVDPMGKGEGVLVVADAGFSVEPLT